MSLIPDFELGFWNAWIITVLGSILFMIPSYINKEVANKRTGEFKWKNPSLIEKYGDAHRGYMNKTPRWIGIPKPEKKD